MCSSTALISGALSSPRKNASSTCSFGQRNLVIRLGNPESEIRQILACQGGQSRFSGPRSAGQHAVPRRQARPGRAGIRRVHRRHRDPGRCHPRQAQPEPAGHQHDPRTAWRAALRIDHRPCASRWGTAGDRSVEDQFQGTGGALRRGDAQENRSRSAEGRDPRPAARAGAPEPNARRLQRK